MNKNFIKKGFTLLEILIALSIFSIMAVVSTTALYNIFHTQDAINKESMKLSQLQLAFIRLERDITQIVNRPIELASSHMEFSTFGQSNPLGISQNSSLTRIKYDFQNKQLIRYSKPNAQIITPQKANKEVLLNDINSLSLHFLDDKYQLQSVWYPRYLPRAVRVDIDSEYFGKISRFFALPQTIKVSVKHENKKATPHEM